VETAGYVPVGAVTAAAAEGGIGRRMMSAAREWARRQGCALITLEVFARSTTARAIYARLGYQEPTLKLARHLPATPDGGEE
jgi:GNAT superfamily N-acetyltransferase